MKYLYILFISILFLVGCKQQECEREICGTVKKLILINNGEQRMRVIYVNGIEEEVPKRRPSNIGDQYCKCINNNTKKL